ncbi:DNA (cytosine-5-)-methyltransferase [Virgibacillus dakarensis]|nr:DNA (cytosine-5-)-methyltransferase [Virgibacillus dakarensis]
MIEVNKKKSYKIVRESLNSIQGEQLEVFEEGLRKDKNGNINIPFSQKGYLCNNDLINSFNEDVQAISFFSGGGGLDIGSQLAGVKVISSMDFDKDSVETLRANNYFSHTKHFHKDISDMSADDYEEILKKNNPKKLILLGGPPCQPFSKAGYWVTNKKRKASSDPRNMIGQYFRMIAELNPDGFILENVESILHPSNKEAVQAIEKGMEDLGYHYVLLRINAADYGIPQKRKRVFFVASKNPIDSFLEPTHGTEKDRQSNPNLLPHEKVIDWIGKYDDPMYAEPSELNLGKYEEEFRSVPPGKNYIALTEKAGYPNPKFVAGKRYWTFLLKLHPNLPSWTIIASPGSYEGPFHWTNRRLRMKELAAIQTFPEDYVFMGSPRSQRKQIGNAVPPLLGAKIVEYLCRWL